MSSIVVRLLDNNGEPVSGLNVKLWWRGPFMAETVSEEYTNSSGEATFNYSTDNWSGDQVSVYVEGDEMEAYHSPQDYYEFTVDN